MSIRIEVHKDLALDTNKTVLEDISMNRVRKWKFNSLTKDWTFTYTGSFRKACFVARKIYNKAFDTYYGHLLLVDVQDVEPKPKLAKSPQLNLDL